MKIFFLAPANSVHTVRWVNSMVARNHTVYLAFLRNHKNVEGSLDERIQLVELPISGTKGYYLNAFLLKRIVREIQPDVVNVHYASGYGTLMRMAGLKQALLSVWGSDVYEFPYISKLHTRIIKKNLCYANKIAATSKCMAEQTCKIMQKNVEIAITPFGVDLNIFKEKEPVAVENVVIGCVKTLEPVYRINDLVYAIGILKQKLQEKNLSSISEGIRCPIYGDGSQKEELQNLIKELNLVQTVTLEGKIPHKKVPNVLEKMDIFCVLSERESFGVAAVEAAAVGLPVVASDASGFEEVVENSVTGIIVKKNNPEMAAEGLMRLVLNQELRRKMGQAGRRRVEELYDWEKNVDIMEQIYMKLGKVKLEK